MMLIRRTLTLADYALTGVGALFGVLALWSWGAYWLMSGGVDAGAEALLFTVACVVAFIGAWGLERIHTRED